ncbi:MAG: hypothetical protein IJL74_04640 [Bacilli bacterium]|nr:hypothetical protein [Bacilli bacterium]
MEKDRRARVIAIAALLVGVVGLSLGFAAFTNTLTIKSSAEVVVDSSVFNVVFSKQSGSVVDGSVTPTLSPANGPASFTGANATITNSGTGAPKIEGLKATFTAPGQSVTYSFYTKNAGALKAYLTSVNFAEVTTGATKTCTAKSVQSPATPATASLVAAACNGISLTVTLGSESFTQTTARNAFTTATAHDLEADGYETVTVVIAYAAGSAQADGDFDVAFGDVTLNYSSVAS